MTEAPESGFVHLHVHTEFSSLDGLIRVDDAFRVAAEHGEPALAVTDHGTLGGLWKAQAAADKHGVKLIPGIEVYLALKDDGTLGSRFTPGRQMVDDDDATDDSDAIEGESSRQKSKKYYHLTVMATTPQGWRNLVRINNESAETMLGKYPMVDIDLLAKHSEGLVALTGCLGGPVLGPLSRGDYDLARANTEAIVAAFAPGSVFVEVMEHGIEVESRILPDAARLAESMGLRMVATNDAHHTHEEDAHAHEAWLALRSTTVLSDPKRYKFHGEGFFLRTEAQMRALRPEQWWQDAVANTGFIADMTAPRVLPEAAPALPVFPTPAGFNTNLDYFMHLVREGVTALYGPDWQTARPDVRDRLNEELAVINPMGFIDYFLIVHEVVSWAKANNILVGPGRGSAAGSLTAYALGITGIDPLENKLLFERFLEPGRSDFPDIDIDFERARRDDILDHLEEKWGKTHVALIGSFSAAKTKRSIRDAARVLELPAVGNRLAKLVPVEGGNPFTFDQLFDETKPQAAAFRVEVDRLGADALKVIELARGFDDAVNGVGIHACGVVISDRDLTDLIPLRRHKNGRFITAWDSKDVEKFGLLKLDVLALRNLDIAARAVEYIAETTGETIDVYSIPHPNTQGDPKVNAAWRLLQDGRTAGIFQMESPAMTKLARDVQPDNLTDLSAVIALFRPGALSAQMDQQYARRKQGREQVSYDVYSVDPGEQQVIATILGDTYGTLVFQEQMMLLGTAVAGFDAKGRSTLRRAIGKKDKALMEQVKGQFIAGGTSEVRDEAGNVISPPFRVDTIERLWSMMEGAASYSFNASHSAAYAQLAYVTAYLKANWPASYGAAILASTDTANAEKRTEALKALPQEGIEILPPDVNLSGTTTRPEGRRSIRLGLGEIKGVGHQAGEAIVADREANNAPFASFYDLVWRVRRDTSPNANDPNLTPLASNQIVGLIEAGALDSFGPRMGLTMVARLIKHGDVPVPNMEWGLIERAARQRARLLVSLGEHPLTRFQEEIKAWRTPVEQVQGYTFAGEPAKPIGLLPSEDGARVTAIGLLAQFAESSYRGGRKANIRLEGSVESIDGIMWDKSLTIVKDSGGPPPIGWPVAISGRISLREFEQEDEAGETFITQLRELVADKIYRVDVNSPVVGELSRDVVVPVLTGAQHETLVSAGGELPLNPPAVTEPVPHSVADPTSDDVPVFEPPVDEVAPEDAGPAALPVTALAPVDFGPIEEVVEPPHTPAPAEAVDAVEEDLYVSPLESPRLEDLPVLTDLLGNSLTLRRAKGRAISPEVGAALAYGRNESGEPINFYDEGEHILVDRRGRPVARIILRVPEREPQPA